MENGRGVETSGEPDGGSSSRLSAFMRERLAAVRAASLGPGLNGPGAPRRASSRRADTGGTTAPLEPWIYASTGDMRRDYDATGDAVGGWLGKRAEWQWFVTCTLRPPRTRGFSLAGSGEARRCLRALLSQSRATDYVCVFELQGNGATHLHALLAGCQAIVGSTAEQFFFREFGISRWKAFKTGGNAPKYLGKYLGKDVVEMYIGSGGPWDEEYFKVFLGGFTKKLTPTFQWSTDMKGQRV